MNATKDTSTFFYGWIIVAGCFVAAMSYGLFYSFGVFFESFQNEFGWSRTITSSVHSVHLVIFSISGIILGRMTDKYGARIALMTGGIVMGVGLMLCSQITSLTNLYLFYGVASFGAGVVYSLPNATVQKWFIARRGMVLGIAMAGIGFGTLILSPLAGFLIQAFDWRTAYLILGAGAAVVLFGFGALMVPSPEKIGLKPYGWAAQANKNESSKDAGRQKKEEKIDDKKVYTTKDTLKTKEFWGIYLFNFFAVAPVLMVMVHLVPHATDVGVPKTIAAGALGLVGGCSIAGRILMGTFSDKIGFRNGLLLCVGIYGLMMIWLISISQAWSLYVFVILFGFFYGGMVPLVPGLVGSFFGTTSLAELLGIMATAAGFAGVAGPITGGYVYDVTGTYTIAFLLGTLSCVIAVLLCLRVAGPPKPIS